MLNKKALAAFAAGATLLSGFAFAAPANADGSMNLVNVLKTETFTAPAPSKLDSMIVGGGAGYSAGSYDEAPAAPAADDATPVIPIADDETPAADDDFNFDDFNLDDFNFDDLDLSDVEDAPAAPVADDATPAAADDFNFDNFDFSDVDDAPAADNAAPAPAVKHTPLLGVMRRAAVAAYPAA